MAEARLVGVDVDGNPLTDGSWAYNSGDGGKIYNFISGFQEAASAGNHISFKAEKNSLLSGETLTFWGWYPPLPEKSWPALKLALINDSDATIDTSIDSKPARTEATSTGKVYYFTAEWNEAQLQFDDDSPVNIIVNGGFEDDFSPSSTEATFDYRQFVSFVRSSGFFDALSQTSSPTHLAVEIPDYVWFEKGTSQNQCRTHVDHLMAHTGEKSAFLWNIGGNTSNATAGSKGWIYHNLAQRVSLDDSKKYEFSFYAKKENPTYNAYVNHIQQLHVGIISSTGATPLHNETHTLTVDLPDNEEWNKITVTFDIPSIIANNPGKSFETSAVYIAIRTAWDEDAGKTLQSKVNIDDVSLIEVE